MRMDADTFRQRSLSRLQWTIESVRQNDEFHFDPNDLDTITRLYYELWDAISQARVIPNPMRK